MERILKVIFVVELILSSLPHLGNSANVFTAFSRGFEHQEEIKYASKTIKLGGGLEEKIVPSKTWACTDQPSESDSDSSQITVFLRLFDYLDGNNEKGERLPMGIPVSIEAAGTRVDRNLTACFFLPESVQGSPPSPKNPLVRLQQRPTITIITKQFGGYANSEETWDAETDNLKNNLESSGISVQPNLVFWNAYDPPIKFWGRRNEVWFVKA